MSRRVAISNLNASTIDILNTIRQNASYEYQSLVPVVETQDDIPKVGEVIYGYPAIANQFLNALINRIAAVRVKSATFNNQYADLKKGYLEFGETVEEVFVAIAKAREFSAEKGAARELKRTLPDVRSAFHAMNWRVQYPITIQDQDLMRAFTSIDGVQDLIAKIVDAVYTAAEYDEFLLFKYLMIKAITAGKMYPVAVDTSDITNAAKAFRGTSNMLTFMSDKYNADGVHTTTPKDDQYIFMDADFNASYDVDVLAAAFNMDKADFMGRLNLVDSWSTFDNERFDEIRKNSDQIEEVTDAELALMKDVKAVLVDREWFQIYDNHNRFTESYVAAGEYWNYFYNVWKTVSYSPFSNAVVFVDSVADIDLPASVSVTVTGVTETDESKVLTLTVDDNVSFSPADASFVQTESAASNLIAVHPYGAIVVPTGKSATVDLTIKGTTYACDTAISDALTVGTVLTYTKS